MNCSPVTDSSTTLFRVPGPINEPAGFVDQLDPRCRSRLGVVDTGLDRLDDDGEPVVLETKTAQQDSLADDVGGVSEDGVPLDVVPGAVHQVGAEEHDLSHRDEETILDVLVVDGGVLEELEDDFPDLVVDVVERAVRPWARQWVLPLGEEYVEGNFELGALAAAQ